MKKGILNLVFLVLIINTHFLKAETHIVSPGSFLSGAVRNAVGGDTVLIEPGTYTSLYLTDMNFALDAPVIVKSDGTGEVILTGDFSSGYYNGVSFTNCSYIVLEDVTINTFNVGVRATDCNHIIFNNLIIHNIGYGAMHTFNSNYIDILNCTIYGTGMVSPKYGEGIYIGSGGYESDYSDFPNNCENIWIEGNEIYECGRGEGINVKGESFHVTVQNNIVHDIYPGTYDQSNKAAITIEGSPHSIDLGYRVDESRDVWVLGNLVYNVTDGYEDYWNNGIKIHTTGAYVFDNTIDNCVNSGIFYTDYADMGMPAYINGNTITNCAVEMDISSGLTYYTTQPSNPNSPQTWYDGVFNVPCEGISLLKSSTDINVGWTEKLIASILPLNATNTSVTWSSSNTAVASVNQDGVVTSVSVGTATITATSVDGGFTAECLVSAVILPEYTVTITGLENGTVDLTPVGGVYPEGTEVKAEVTADYAYRFEEWTGDIISEENPITFTINQDMLIEAVITAIPEPCLAPTPVSMPFEQDGVGEFCWVANGSITKVNSWNMDYLEINGEDYTNVYSKTINASEDGKIYIYYLSTASNAHFEILGEDAVGVDNYSLSTSVSGLGTISMNPAGGTYQENTLVTLTATAESGWEFSGWSGDASGSSTPLSVTMDSDKNISATFTELVNPIEYSLTMLSTGQGTVTSNPAGGTHTEGTVISVTATADEGWEFSGWSGDASDSSSPLSVTMDSDKSISATFTEVVTPVEHSLTLLTSGQGVVIANPASDMHTEGTVVSLTATTDDGWEFSGWNGDANGSSNPLSVTMDSDKTIEASFSLIPVDSALCDNTEIVELPFEMEGIGEYCFITTGDISYINSWNMEELTINDEDYTNVWSNSIPNKIDGAYSISYKSNVSWSHFEANGLHSQLKSTSRGNIGTEAYPNPFSLSIRINLNNPEQITSVEVFDLTGKVVEQISKTDFGPSIEIGSDYKKGVYIILITSDTKIQRLIVSKK